MWACLRRLGCAVPPACLQVALVDMLYRKSLRLSSAAKSEAGAGKIVNLQVGTRVGGCEYVPACLTPTALLCLARCPASKVGRADV